MTLFGVAGYVMPNQIFTMNTATSPIKSHSDIYRQKLLDGIIEAKNLGLPNLSSIDPAAPVDDVQIKFLNDYLLNEFCPVLYRLLPTYWGNRCQDLSGLLYARLITLGFDADIVYGEVEIGGTLEFDATLESIRKEYNSDNREGSQELHAWVTIGDDTVIDAGLPDRMIKHYRFPERYMPPIMVGRAKDISEMFKAIHQPLLVGTDFIAKTNTVDPRSLTKMFLGIGARTP